MEGLASKIKTPKRKNMKIKRHYVFYVVTSLASWITPPLAVLIRFGIGRDFFINIILTLCGYIPGHFHKSNKGKARTPRWAVKYGLVKVKNPRGGKHQWAGQYDERLPNSAQAEYDADPTTGEGGTWDGRGPEPASNRAQGKAGGGQGRSFFTPWAAVVDEDEVEGGPDSLPQDPSAPAADPLDNEQFYASGTQTGAPVDSESGSNRRTKKGKKDKGIKGLLGHRSRYENQDEAPSRSGQSGDRFDRMDSARSGSMNGNGDDPQEEYADEFEAELNRGASAHTSSGAPSAGAALNARRDEDEGPEDAWANTGSHASETTGSRQGTQADTELFNHTF